MQNYMYALLATHSMGIETKLGLVSEFFCPGSGVQSGSKFSLPNPWNPLKGSKTTLYAHMKSLKTL
jgi:hypothetical protein